MSAAALYSADASPSSQQLMQQQPPPQYAAGRMASGPSAAAAAMMMEQQQLHSGGAYFMAPPPNAALFQPQHQMLDNQGGLQCSYTTMVPFGSAAAAARSDASASSSRARLHHTSGGGGVSESGLSTLPGAGDQLVLMPSGSAGALMALGGGEMPPNVTVLRHNHAPGYASPDICHRSGCTPVLLGVADPMGMEGAELEDLEPVPRNRCNTWPLRRPTLDINAQTSPLIHDRIPEEENVYDDEFIDEEADDDDTTLGRRGHSDDTVGDGRGAADSPLDEFSGEMSPMRSDSAIGADECSHTNSPPNIGGKKSTTRRNAWGNMSYADLITQAILNSPEKRLTLSQVYDWMVQNVPYFRDKGDSNSSAGWKNSIRHNLSLHSRFMRIQNEGAGKSSWWVINPDAKAGRSPRRRAATMENTTKAVIDKKRRGARKRTDVGSRGGGAPLQSAATSLMGSQASLSQELYNDCEDTLGPNFETFRGRTQSTLSNVAGSSRVSPTLEPPGFEDFDFPPWMDAGAAAGQQHTMGDILDRTDQIRIIEAAALTTADVVPSFQQRTILSNGVKLEPAEQLQSPTAFPAPQQTLKRPLVKSEFPAPEQARHIQPPPSYQQLAAVRGSTPLQGLLQRGPMPPPPGAQRPAPYYHQQQQQASGELYGQQPMLGTQRPTWAAAPQAAQQQQQQFAPMQQQPMDSGDGGRLPLDLENLAMDQSIMDLDMDAVLRHELAHTRDNRLQFDMP